MAFLTGVLAFPRQGEIMRKLLLIAVSTALMSGCVSDGKAHWYDEAVKDARGDNQQMRGFSKTKTIEE